MTTQLSFQFDSGEPLEYTIKESARARRVSLRVEAGRKVLVTVPKRFPRREIRAIIEAQRDWIERSLQAQEAAVPEEFRDWPPRRLVLAAVDATIAVEYEAAPVSSQRRGVARWTGDTTLQLAVDHADRELVSRLLADALKQKARDTLVPWLETLAAQHGLTFVKAAVRGQKRLWGSYSSSGTLSLNYKLLFLPAAHTQYVLLHELAHTRHLDHSPAFWHLLEKLEPASRQLDRELVVEARAVPPWLA